MIIMVSDQQIAIQRGVAEVLGCRLPFRTRMCLVKPLMVVNTSFMARGKQ